MDSCRYSGRAEGLPGKIRLDRYAAEYLKLLSRSQIKSRALEAKINGKKVKISRPVQTGDLVELSWLASAPLFLEPEEIPLDLIYEDRRCVVINKPQGMVVHPGAGNPSGTLANALLWRRLYSSGEPAEGSAGPENPPPPDLSLRTGIVHRLDKDTSGVIIAAYDDEALALLSAQFKERTVQKRYLALVQGTPEETAGSIHARLIRDPRDRKRFAVVPPDPRPGRSLPPELRGLPAGKAALTRYRVLKSWKDYSFVLLKPKTGRTHQLRLHLQYLGHPILGDPLYGSRDKRFPAAAMMLHAWTLSLVLPGQERSSSFRAPLPERFSSLIAELNRRPES
ncbi:MAG: RluA family pseudouridine synthase [Spirochaetaceae bacterium]|jgi:23S rRNA pseudouridine1911/1915/1917 synthase|nr:RluA family pseudouridine synthase [Spirochaetaceae bacterium]